MRLTCLCLEGRHFANFTTSDNFKSNETCPGLLKDGKDGKAVALDFDGMAVTSPGVEKLPQFSV